MKKGQFRFYYLVLSALVVLAGAKAATLFSGCGDDDTISSTLSQLSALVPAAGLASPTAQSSGAAFRSTGKRDVVIFAENEGKSIEAAKQEIATILAEDEIAKCFTAVSFPSGMKPVSCYGPNLVYTGHPGGAGNGCQQGVTPTPNGTTYCLPGGDLGLWSATESTGEACSSAQLNALVGDVSGIVNNALKIMAGMVCVAQIKGYDKPATGASLDLLADASAAISGSTLTKATIGRDADYTGTTNPVYAMSVEGTFGGLKVALTLKHSPDANGSDYKGRLYGTVGDSSPNQQKGVSVTYSKTGDALGYVTKSARIPTTATNIFNAAGEFQFSAFSSGGSDGRYMVANLSESTGLGNLKFAWQAGNGDSKARVFHVSTSSSGGSDTGFAYFGFGPNFATGPGEIGGMCCNWAGPSGSGEGGVCMGGASYDAVGEAQSQVIARNSAGLFVPAAGGGITYAPTKTCDYSGGTLKYMSTTEWALESDNSWADDSVASVTNNLTTTTAIGTMPTITEPSFAP